ncbi:MAG: PAS domain S-box protein, partial [Pseudomonadota bacterium]
MTQSPTDDAFGTNSPAYFDASDAGALQTLLSTILASVPDAMIVIDESGRIVAFSAAAEAMFGYQAEDVRGKNVSCLMTDADRPHHDEYIGTYLKTGRRRIIGIGRVVKARLADNREIPVDLKIGEAKIGEHRLFTGYIRDLSEQQRAEHRLREMQAELTNFSRLSVVGTMASAMAHELNQPLTAVANYLEASRDLLQ